MIILGSDQPVEFCLIERASLFPGFVFRAPRAGTLRNLFASFYGITASLNISIGTTLYVEILSGAAFPPTTTVLAASVSIPGGVQIGIVYNVQNTSDVAPVSQGDYIVVTYRAVSQGSLVSVAATTSVGGSYLFV